MILNNDAEHSDQQTKEIWNLRQYNFLAGGRKTVPLTCRSHDWI